MSDIDALIERVRELGAAGGIAEARRLLDEAASEHDKDPAALCRVALLCAEIDEGERARTIFKLVLDSEPDDPSVMSVAGSALAASGDPEGEAAMRTAALLAPDEAYVRLAWGVHLTREGMAEDGIRELLAAAAGNEDDPLITMELGIGYALGGRFGRARAAMAMSVQTDPADSWGRTLLGLVELEDGDPVAAATDLVAAAGADPADFEVQLLAALAAAGAGWETKAHEMLERARFSAQAEDEEALDAAEAAICDGPESAAELLAGSVAPAALRTRLQVRPW